MIGKNRDFLMVLLKKRTFTPCCEMQMNMEKKEIVEKISSKCKILDWLETVEMDKWVKKEMKEELKRKRRSYDKVLGLTEKKKKFGDCLEECNLEKKRVYGRSLV